MDRGAAEAREDPVLQTTVKIPNADTAGFQKAVETAKSGCPVSKLLNATITLDAKLA